MDKGRLLPLTLTERNAPVPPRGRGNTASIQEEVTKQFVEEAAQYLHQLEFYFGVKIARIAIDAPKAPRKDGLSRRLSEAALIRKGIPSFPTPGIAGIEYIKQKVQAHLSAGGTASSLPAANQLWMLVGFALFARLQEEWECLEVYPQATMHAIGAAKVHKSKKEGLAAQIEAVAQHTGWDELAHRPREALKGAVSGALHDGLDAYSSAWVASLEAYEREAFGSPPDDAIWVPTLAKIRTIERL